MCWICVSCNKLDDCDAYKEDDSYDSGRDMGLDDEGELLVYIDFIPRINDAVNTVGYIDILCKRRWRWI